jgi:excisionase family DNA binding protein
MEQKFDSIRLLTLDEAAALLQVSKRTLHRMIKTNELPAFKVGGQWRLRETQLRQWVEHRESSATERERKGDHFLRTQPKKMNDAVIGRDVSLSPALMHERVCD